MEHLFVDLFDRVNDSSPIATLDDRDVNNRVLFHDLHLVQAADRVARVRVRPGDEYRTGDHIRLLDAVRISNTDTVCVDPSIRGDVDLHDVRFDDRPAAVNIILNPNADGGFRLRVSLFDRTNQAIPNLILYDYEFPPHIALADLHLFNFDDRAAFVRVERGPNFQQGDRILHFSDRAAAVAFDF